MVEGKWFAQGSDIALPLALREAALGMGGDAMDDLAQQVVVYQTGEPVGTARLYWQDGAFRVGEIGVLPTQRGHGYGDLLVRLLLYKAVSHHARVVTLGCPSTLVPFFSRYGFTPVSQSDEAFIEMSLNTADMPDGCAGCGRCEA